jgi:transposase
MPSSALPQELVIRGERKGGRTAAILMSLCTTCKELEIDPQAYLRDVLDRISTHPAKRLDESLPDRWQESRRAGAAGTG